MTEIGLFGQELSGKAGAQDVSYYHAMRFFADTDRTEGAFYIRFQVLPRELLQSLKSYFNTNDDFRIFRQVCKAWRVKS